MNDAFACCHRNHLSIVGFDHIAPEEGREGGGGVGGGTGEKRKAEKAFGYLIGTEMRCLESVAMNKNNDKILAIIGGGKMDDKLALLQQLVKKVLTIPLLSPTVPLLFPYYSPLFLGGRCLYWWRQCQLDLL